MTGVRERGIRSIPHPDHHNNDPKLSPIEIVKEAVPVEDYASTLTELRNHRGRCPIHGGDNDQAFAVYPDEGRWWCYRCDEGGDVIDLCAAVEKDGAWNACLAMAERHGVELPKPKPDRYLKHQDQKGAIRNAALRHIARVYQRRLTLVYAPLVLLGGETPEEEIEALTELSSALWPVSLDLAGRRVSGEE